MGRISINQIKALPYEGYLWMSDKEQPQIYNQENISLPKEGDNPFVVEGMLYNKANELSYSIRFVDGEYIVQEFKVTQADIKNPENQEKVYEPNRMDDLKGKRLRFLRYWEEVLDEDNYKDEQNPDGLPVLTLTKNVFIGFKEKEDTI